MNKDIRKHLAWIIGLFLIVFTICLTISTTIVYLQSNAWIIRFEMDNNTLEAVKSVNWSVMPK